MLLCASRMAIRLVARPQRCERRERNEFAKAFMFEGILRCPTMPSSVKCEAQTLRARRKKLVIARERALPGARMSKSLHMVQPLFRGSSPGGSLAWGGRSKLGAWRWRRRIGLVCERQRQRRFQFACFAVKLRRYFVFWRLTKQRKVARVTTN